jgi:hypothetical protein
VRGRLIALVIRAALLVLVAATIAETPFVHAAEQQPPLSGGGGEATGDDQYARGELLDDGSGAEAVAGDRRVADDSHRRRGGGNVVCSYFDEGTGEPVNPSQLPASPDGEPIQLVRQCDDATTGEYVSIDVIAVRPGGRPDPADLAVMARSRLPFDAGDVSFSPPLDSPDDFLLVQLETWIWRNDWRTISRTASAGGVVTTVTATPVRQEWDFTPDRSDPDTEGGCPGPGTKYDPSKPPDAQSTECSITFRHSSAGEPDGVYEGHLTVIYAVTWGSNIGVGGSLGEVPQTTVIPVRVGEQQALNESGGTQQ